MSESYPDLINEILADSQDVSFNFESAINWKWELLVLYGQSINKILLRNNVTKLLSYQNPPAPPARMSFLANKAVTIQLTELEWNELWGPVLGSLGVYSNGESYYTFADFYTENWYLTNKCKGIFIEPFTIEDGLANMIKLTDTEILTERDKVITQFILTSPEIAAYRTDLESLMSNQQKYIDFLNESFINPPGILYALASAPIPTVEVDEIETTNTLEIIEVVKPISDKTCSLCNSVTTKTTLNPTSNGEYQYKCTYADCGHYDYY